jgi:NDP-sugar pyrophosphorylase family protein
MTRQEQTQYPVLVICGRDRKRRKLLQVLDPDENYPSKALLPFLGKRVIDWQLEALIKSPYVEGLYIIGLTEEQAPFAFPVDYVPTETTADFPDKLADGLAYLNAQGKNPGLVIISTSDAPAMRLESINNFFEQLKPYQDYDFVLSVVPEAITNDVFPDARRVVARLRDHRVFPGELYALSPKGIRLGQSVIHDFNQLRRAIDRQGETISLGPVLRYLAQKPQTWWAIIKYIFRQATLEDVERAFSRAFHCKAKAIIIPDPGFGMDMDLPEDYEKLKAYVKKSKLHQQA